MTTEPDADLLHDPYEKPEPGPFVPDTSSGGVAHLAAKLALDPDMTSQQAAATLLALAHDRDTLTQLLVKYVPLETLIGLLFGRSPRG